MKKLSDKKKQLFLNLAAANVIGLFYTDLVYDAVTLMNEIGWFERVKNLAQTLSGNFSLMQKIMYLAAMASPVIVILVGLNVFVLVFFKVQEEIRHLQDAKHGRKKEAN